MSNQTATAAIMRHLYKNPGVWTAGKLAQATGHSISTCSRVLRMMSELEPKIIEQVNRAVYFVRPPAYEDISQQPEPEPLPLIAGPAASPHDWVEIEPEDEDLYPPFRIRIYDHWKGKRGEQWFRVKDEVGKRGVFRWLDDE